MNTLGFIVVAIAIVVTGYGIARLFYVRTTSEPIDELEVFIAGAILGIALWLGATWILSAFHALTATALRWLAAAFIAAALAFVRHVRFRRPGLATMCTIAAIGAWTIFAAWRGSVTPPASHDVLTYHLPRAVLIARAHGIERFDVRDPRIRHFPANYELLLSDVILLEGDDSLTEWVAIAFWLLFLGEAALLARLWWGKGPHVAASVLAAAAAPVLLVHSGADKNDVMTGAFALGAILWSARWCARGGIPAAAMAMLCGALAIGTKLTAGVVLLSIVPFGLAAWIRRRPPLRHVLVALVFAAIAFLLCGGWIFIQNATAAPESATKQMTVGGLPTARYGDWENLWQLPLVLMRVSAGRPFWFPGNDEWPWSTHNIFASHFGMLVTPLVIALPFCVMRYRFLGSDEARNERRIAGLIALLAFAALLPLEQRPRAAASAITRYSVFILPVVIAWTLAPIVRELASLRRRLVLPAVFAILLAIFAQQAVESAIFDTFVPFEYARWAAAHPGTRRIHFTDRRAASVADTMAGPADTIAVISGSDTWLHPAYGARLTRPVIVLASNSHAAGIPPSAQWVTVDRADWMWSRKLEEIPLVAELLADCHFRVVHWDRRLRQAVFRRVACSAREPVKSSAPR